jgi:Cdc6-like AAA superfamily ATPase
MVAHKNPFLKPPIVNSKDIWSDQICDFEEIHADASQKIFDALQQVKGTFSIAIVGNVGSGKTQLFSRVRHKLSSNEEAFCVYVNADQIASLDFISVAFQQFLVDSLFHTGKSGVTYLQEIATNLVNQALEGIKSTKRFSVHELLEQFNQLATNKSLVDKITGQVQQLKPYLSDSSEVIRALLWTLSASSKPILDESDFLTDSPTSSKSTNYYLAPSATDWLKGIEINEDDARIMKLSNKSFKDEERESEALKRAMQVLRIASEYKSVVICFDELDATKYNKHANGTAEVISDLIKTLHNGLDKVEYKNSILILSLWLNDTFRQSDFLTDSGLIERVCSLADLKKEPISLDKNLLTEETGLKLVDFWLDKLDARNPENPYQPLGGEEKIKHFCKNRPNPRQLQRWCAENWMEVIEPLPPIENGGDTVYPPPPPLPDISLEEIYKILADDEYSQLMEDETLIVESLMFSLEKAIGQTIENVLIKKITRQPKNAKFQFKIEGLEDGKTVSIGVGVCQSANGATVGAMLLRLLEYPKYKLTRGCLVRSESKKISRRTQAFENLTKLTSPPFNGEFVPLKYNEIVEVYALHLLSQKPEITKLDPDEISAFIISKAIENELIKEILSDPSGVIPASAISQPRLFISDDNNKDDTDLSDDDFNVSDGDDNRDKLRELIEEWISEQYPEPLTVIFCESDKEITGVTFGLFLEHRRNWLFEYQVTEAGISYQPIELVRELSSEKLEILSELDGDEIVALVRLVRISKAIGGTVTILNDADFEDQDAALEIYGFYPPDLEANPALYYRHEQLGVSIGTQLFWGDEDTDSLSFGFVNDIHTEDFSVFDSFDEALNFGIMRLNYYIEES